MITSALEMKEMEEYPGNIIRHSLCLHSAAASGALTNKNGINEGLASSHNFKGDNIHRISFQK